MGLRGRLKKLQKAAEGEMVALRLRDGTTARFYEDDVFPGCFLHETARWRRSYNGEDPGPAHPFVEAMRNAAEGEVERLAPTQGTMILTFLGEDAIMRGEMERPGSPASLRETSPGVYE
jgi:hypothetical protein